MVIAGTLPLAKDAAELVDVQYDPLPSVTDVASAAKPKSEKAARSRRAPR